MFSHGYVRCHAAARSFAAILRQVQDKTWRSSLRDFVLLLLIIVYSVEGVKRSKADCIVCGKKSQKDSFRIVRTSDSDVENCFGVKISSCE